MRSDIICYFFFFFQAEDGIRDVAVTGVQTCALPISVALEAALLGRSDEEPDGAALVSQLHDLVVLDLDGIGQRVEFVGGVRSEERRVGKECRSRWSPYH